MISTLNKAELPLFLLHAAVKSGDPEVVANMHFTQPEEYLPVVVRDVGPTALHRLVLAEFQLWLDTHGSTESLISIEIYNDFLRALAAARAEESPFGETEEEFLYRFGLVSLLAR